MSNTKKITKGKKEKALAKKEKVSVKKAPKKEDLTISPPKNVSPEEKTKFISSVGRRKTASARVWLFTQGTKGIMVNNKPYTDYFSVKEWQRTLEDPLRKLNILGKFGFSIKVRGGGLSGQSEAARYGIARTLVLLNPYFKKRLKKSGYLTRDSRMRERKKPGLKRARKAPQWSKR